MALTAMDTSVSVCKACLGGAPVSRIALSEDFQVPSGTLQGFYGGGVSGELWRWKVSPGSSGGAYCALLQSSFNLYKSKALKYRRGAQHPDTPTCVQRCYGLHTSPKLLRNAVVHDTKLTSTSSEAPSGAVWNIGPLWPRWKSACTQNCVPLNGTRDIEHVIRAVMCNTSEYPASLNGSTWCCDGWFVPWSTSQAKVWQLAWWPDA